LEYLCILARTFPGSASSVNCGFFGSRTSVLVESCLTSLVRMLTSFSVQGKDAIPVVQLAVSEPKTAFMWYMCDDVAYVCL